MSSYEQFDDLLKRSEQNYANQSRKEASVKAAVAAEEAKERKNAIEQVRSSFVTALAMVDIQGNLALLQNQSWDGLGNITPLWTFYELTNEKPFVKRSHGGEYASRERSYGFSFITGYMLRFDYDVLEEKTGREGGGDNSNGSTYTYNDITHRYTAIMGTSWWNLPQNRGYASVYSFDRDRPDHWPDNFDPSYSYDCYSCFASYEAGSIDLALSPDPNKELLQILAEDHGKRKIGGNLPRQLLDRWNPEAQRFIRAGEERHAKWERDQKPWWQKLL